MALGQTLPMKILKQQQKVLKTEVGNAGRESDSWNYHIIVFKCLVVKEKNHRVLKEMLLNKNCIQQNCLLKKQKLTHVQISKKELIPHTALKEMLKEADRVK